MSVIQLTLDDVIIEDYTTSFNEHYAIINNCIGMLNSSPNDEDIINEVFRSLHTIKGNADMCQFSVITKFSHVLEDVVAEIRDGNLEYQSLIGEVLLLCLDKAKEIGECIFSSYPVNQALIDDIEQELKKISQQSDELKNIAKNIVRLISGHIVDNSNNSVVDQDYGGNKSMFVNENGAASEQPESTAIPRNAVDMLPCPYAKDSAISDTEFDFLRGLKAWCCLMERKIPYWFGRLERTLPLVMAMYSQIDAAIDQIQLEAALYVHDVSFAFLSNHLLHKDSKFDANDIEEMQQHPSLSANLLKHVDGWEVAANIVAQHHEKWDGSGYPQRLRGDEIHAGAQILAIVDAFESMTCLRADRQYKRSVLRAVTEINNCSGTQFNPDMVLVFNSIIRERLKR